MIEQTRTPHVETGKMLVDRRGGGGGHRQGRRANDGFFARWFNRRGERGSARRDRQSCCIVSVMVLIDRNLAIDGLMTGIGRQTILFRPASTYIFDRQGAEVSMRFADHDVRGRVTDVGPTGYVVTLTTLLTDEAVETIIVQFGFGDLGSLRSPQPAPSP